MKKQQITTCQQDKRVRHGGDIYRNPVRYDFSINLNPLGMPEGVKRRLKETVEDWGRYRIRSVKRLREHLPIIIRLRQTGFSAPTARPILFMGWCRP